MHLSTNLIDIKNRSIFPVEIHILNGKIKTITRIRGEQATYILPGFIDAHVHIESSMLMPSEFARMAVTHGTVATVSDPHEIANVLGTEGVYYMIENGKKVPFKFNFGAPSCVPATIFETAGAEVTAADIDTLLSSDDIKYLAEMMNYPGVLYDDPSVTEKLNIAKKYGKPIDGHAPGLKGDNALTYISKGITTDHECYQYDEALFKLQHGMKVIIREGSAAKNFETLQPLIADWSHQMMFCSDDKHPDDLILGHINLLVKRALAYGHNLFNVLQMACINPVEHYKLNVGTLREGDAADFILIDNPIDFNILKTFINGELVAENGNSFIKTERERVLNNFNISKKIPSDFEIKLKADRVNIIEVLDGQLITNKNEGNVVLNNGIATPSVENDILKIAVVNRYHESPVAMAFIKNFGLKRGAIASSVAHDSHNIIAVGVDDESICKVVNAVIDTRGGLSVTNGFEIETLGLPVAGLMSGDACEVVADKYLTLVRMAKEDLGSTLGSPFMSLSFMALLVIPRLKLSDKGLFDGESFTFCPLEIA
jgi:adenine deaminase